MNDKTSPWHTPPNLWAKLRPLAREMRRAATPEEDLVWERLRGRRFHGLRFRRQHAIGPFIVDFYCHEKQLIIEVDGGIHEGIAQQDAARQQYLEHLGFAVLRLDNHEVNRDLSLALNKLSQELNHPTPVAERGRG